MILFGNFHPLTCLFPKISARFVASSCVFLVPQKWFSHPPGNYLYKIRYVRLQKNPSFYTGGTPPVDVSFFFWFGDRSKTCRFHGFLFFFFHGFLFLERQGSLNAIHFFWEESNKVDANVWDTPPKFNIAPENGPPQ